MRAGACDTGKAGWQESEQIESDAGSNPRLLAPHGRMWATSVQKVLVLVGIVGAVWVRMAPLESAFVPGRRAYQRGSGSRPYPPLGWKSSGGRPPKRLS